MAQRVHAFGDDALGEIDAVGLAEAIRSGRVSRTEAAEAAIARLEAVNPALNGLAYEAFDRALATAAAPSPSGGFFDGVPTFIKDMEDVAGMPTMWGTDAWLPRAAREDGPFARLFQCIGINSIGKTQMSQIGLHYSAEHPRLGPVRNAWNPDHTAGGSSSGAAALVAAGVVPIAHANDAGGSTRIPASCNGLVGLKPSRGRLPLSKKMSQMPVRLLTEGVLSRSVRDTAAFYREAERVWRNPRLPAIGNITHAGSQRFTIAVCTHSPSRESSRETRQLTLQTAGLLDQLGHRIELVDTLPLPPTFLDDFVLYWAALAMAMVRGGRSTFGPSFDPTRLDNLTLELGHYATRNLHRLPLVVGRLAALRRHTARFFSRYDVLLTPTTVQETPRIGHLDPTDHWLQVVRRVADWIFTPLHNATGDPAISLPLAQTAAGLPQGMQLSAERGAEARLLQLAYELEEARPWARIQDESSSHNAKRAITR